MVQSVQKIRKRASLENAESILAAIIVFCLLAIILTFFLFNPGIRSAIAEAMQPSDDFIATVESDPFSVLGVVCLPIVVFVLFIFVLFTGWLIARKFVRFLFERTLVPDSGSAMTDREN
jgi:ribose/xylose/arabinose/galactoside ABC-type transport system permease subunit